MSIDETKNKTGKVGAFWVFPGSRVQGEACSLSTSERVGGYCNGLQGHDALWPGVVKPVDFLGRGYGTVPRGRVLYRESESCFVVFAAPEIVRDRVAREAVEEFYSLSAKEQRLLWQTDPHYITQPDLIDLFYTT